MKRRGFTITELIIVITLMGIFLTLGVVNLRSSQANGRDSERKIDIETISQHLENYYNSGSDTSTDVGTYPSTDIIGKETTYLRDLDVKTLAVPDSSTSSFVATSSQPPAVVVPTPTINNYVYQPLKSDGSLCTQTTDECSKFNLYYALEIATADCPAPDNICMVKSKNQ